jgi:hypothetical protein
LPADAPEEAELSDPIAVVYGFEKCAGPSFRARYMDKMLDGKAIFPALSQGDHAMRKYSV